MFGRTVCIALVLALGITAPAQAANWFEKNFWLSGPEYSRDTPPCDYPPALHEIINNFRTKEMRFWNSDLQIVGIEDMQESAYLPWAAQSILRRFCRGTALINDHTAHPIYYSIAPGRHDRHGLGHKFLRRRVRSELGIQSSLPRRQALIAEPCLPRHYQLASVLSDLGFLS